MSRSGTRLLALALCLTGAACATNSARVARSVFRSEVSRPDSVVVRVVNRADHALRIALGRDRGPVALGEVQAGGEGRFPVRAAEVTGARVTLLATTLAGNATVRSAPFRVQRGQVAAFLITPDLVGSQVFVNWPGR